MNSTLDEMIGGFIFKLIITMKYLFMIFAVVQFISISVSSQVTQQWLSRYEGAVDSSDQAKDIAVDAQGNIYVGATSYGSTSRSDFLLIKYNSAGVQQWAQRYNGTTNWLDDLIAIGLDAAGNIYVTGSTFQSGSIYNIATLKYNPAGVLQWTKVYNGVTNNNDEPEAMKVDAAGNVYVMGITAISGSNRDFLLIKYSAAGNEEWVKTYGGTSNGSDLPQGIALDNSGNIYLTGYTNNTGTGADFTTIKYNSGGSEVWAKKFSGAGGNTAEMGYAVALDPLGNIYATGRGSMGNNSDMLTIKYNSAGDTLWTRKYGTVTYYDQGSFIIVYDENNIYVSGSTYNPDEDIVTLKYDGTGAQIWVKEFDGSGMDNGDMGLQEDFPRDLALDAQGNLYMAGIAYQSGSFHDFVIIKYTPEGVDEWTQFYNGPANQTDGASAVALDAGGNVYVTGTSEYSANNNNDCITIKYSQPIGIHNISIGIPKDFSLGQNYPNPFNPVTNIDFELPVGSKVSLTVYDISGKVVETLVSSVLNAGKYRVDWDASKYSSGVYFYKIETDKFSNIKKMILVK